MELHEWCIAVLKGRISNMRISELFNLCTKHYRERTFDSEDELLVALEPFKVNFAIEDFQYDYVTFEDDGVIDAPIIEIAKEVLRSHLNRYTLSVLCRKMNETGNLDDVLDDATLKGILSSRNCFMIEERSMKIISLSTNGEEYDVAPISFRRPAKSEAEKHEEAEKKRQEKLAKEQERLAKVKERLLRKAFKEEERERRWKLKQKKAERKEEHRIEKIRTIISFYQISDKTPLEELWEDKLIRKEDYIRCDNWGLHTVGQVYAWVVARNLPERLADYRKHTTQRMMKIASFLDPELARLIPDVKFSGIQKAKRSFKLSQYKGESVNDDVEVKLGDVLRWNYTKETGVVVGFDYSEEVRRFIVRQNDGTEILFEDDPKLFTKIAVYDNADNLTKEVQQQDTKHHS